MPCPSAIATYLPSPYNIIHQHLGAIHLFKLLRGATIIISSYLLFLELPYRDRMFMCTTVLDIHTYSNMVPRHHLKPHLNVIGRLKI